MSNTSAKLTWCKASVGKDMNWWVKEISDPIHWDTDGLGIIDPRQFQYILELTEPLHEYGLQTDLIEEAFFVFNIENVEIDKTVLLKRTSENIFESEDPLFILPDIMDEEKGPYADFLDHITKLRVKMLNDLIDFTQKLTIEELEEEIRESQNDDFIEGRTTHFFTEITAILEYVPQGFEIDSDEEKQTPTSEEEALEKDLADVETATDEGEETLVADETMKWEDEEEENFEED